MPSGTPEHAKASRRFEAAREPLNDQLRHLISQKKVEHAIVAIESLDESFRWVGAAGASHPCGPPMEEQTPFWIASVTKLYIAAAVFKLHERDLVALEDSIASYLPRSLINGLHRLDGTDYTDAITVRHLLGHLSGLPDYLEDSPKGEASLLDRIADGEDRCWTLEDALAIVRDTLEPQFPPQPSQAKRPRIRYSDTNYQLLIAIIEVVSGQHLDSVFAEMFYDPLNLANTFHPGSERSSATQPATVWADDRPLDAPLAMRSFGDLASTVDDTLRFMRALVRGQVFEKPGTLDQMMGNWNRFSFSLNPTTMGWPIEYGLGMMRYRFPRIFTPIRPIPAVVGHSGASGSWLFYCPEFDLLFSGTIDQLASPATPFRFVPRLLRTLDKAQA